MSTFNKVSYPRSEVLSSVGKPKISACPTFVSAMQILGQRWTGLILQAIADRCHSFTEIATYCEGLSDAVLARRLRSMEADGLIFREIKSTRPPTSSYSLTSSGANLVPILEQIQTWGEEHFNTPRKENHV